MRSGLPESFLQAAHAKARVRLPHRARKERLRMTQKPALQRLRVSHYGQIIRCVGRGIPIFLHQLRHRVRAPRGLAALRSSRHSRATVHVFPRTILSGSDFVKTDALSTAGTNINPFGDQRQQAANSFRLMTLGFIRRPACRNIAFF